MLSYEFIQFLNDKVLEYLPAQKWRHGDKWNFKCPLCGDGKSGHKHRAWWYDKTASFYCWNQCGGLSGIRFLELVSGRDYADIKQEYTKLFLKSGCNGSLSSYCYAPTSKTDEPSLFKLKPIVKPEWKNHLTEAAKKYLDERKVLDAPFYNGNLYSWTSTKHQEYILIDWVINGVSAYFQLNNFQKHGEIKYIFPKDKKKLVYGLDNIDISFPYIFVFEGFYDSLFVKNGICTGTKAITEYQLRLIRARYPHHQLVISFDNDKPGIMAMTKLMDGQNDFKYFKWFNSNTKEKDINDYVLAKGNVNIFSDSAVLKKLIVDKLMMKMHLIQNGLWITNDSKNKLKHGQSTRGQARKIFKRQDGNFLSASS